MERITRIAIPPFLFNNYKVWGRQWEALKRANPRARFQWCAHGGMSVNHLLLPDLQTMTDYHCSFCDIGRLEEGVIEPTIEHFKPKAKHPLLAYHWENLFLCCYSCQKKGSNFTKDLLKPDRVNYSFDDFFIIDWASGEIHPRHLAPDIRYSAAFNTIDLYGLNKGGKPRARLKELELYQQGNTPNINDFSFRFFISRA